VVGFQHRLRGLRWEHTQPIDLFASLPYRRIGRSQRTTVLRCHRPPLMQQVPQCPRGMRLIIDRPNLGRGKR
jgi:hypothetical protein